MDQIPRPRQLAAAHSVHSGAVLLTLGAARESLHAR
jgi:hypothetical protein